MGTLGEELVRLREGGVTFDAFARTTSADWTKLAEYLYRRWWLPEGVESADVEQELLVSAWSHVGSWDPKRGVSLQSYVVWSACSDAKKWINRQRNAKRRDGKAEGRFPVSFSSFPEGEGPADQRSDDAGLPEDIAEAREQLSLVLGERSEVERAVLASVVASGGDLTRAAAMVWSDQEVCLRARLGSKRDAERLTERVVDEVLGAVISAAGDEQ